MLGCWQLNYMITWRAFLMTATNIKLPRQLSEVTYIFSNISLVLIHAKCAGDFISATTWLIRSAFIGRYWDTFISVYKPFVLDVYLKFCEILHNWRHRVPVQSTRILKNFHNFKMASPVTNYILLFERKKCLKIHY